MFSYIDSQAKLSFDILIKMIDTRFILLHCKWSQCDYLEQSSTS